MEEEKKVCYWKVIVNLIFSILATIVVVYLGIKGLFFFMPFVIGWVISVIAYPLVKLLERKLRIIKKLSTAGIIVLVLALIVLLIYCCISGLLEIGADIIESTPTYYVSLEDELQQAMESINKMITRFPSGAQDMIHAFFDNVGIYMKDVLSLISEPTVSAAGNVAKKVPAFLVSFIVTIVSAYFFVLDREIVIQWVKKVTPNAIQKRMELVNYNFKHAVGGYFKAQFKIMGVIFVILAISFGFLGVKYGILVALLIAMLDFLPFFGTGAAMIPWAIFELLIGEYTRAFIFIVIYIVTQTVRQLIQPKLVADSIGLNPIVTLLLLYVGYQFSGVIGMIVAIPVGMIVINLLKAGAFDYIINDVKILLKGILKLRE